VNTIIDEGVVWCDREELHSKAASFIRPVSTVLDIGCGIRPQQYITPEQLICVEPHPEYVELLKENLKDSSSVIIPLDAIQALAGMPDRSIDSIFLIDVIEHMEKEVGAQVLLECERVARQQVIIFTPLGFMPQEVHAGAVDGWNLHGGEWQDHKSGWYPEEFPGWDIIGCKHLHLQDYLGQDIDPPYGGFYAIKNINKVANHFNDVYSNDIIASRVAHLDWLHDNFPLLSEKVVGRDINASYLKCGLAACQRTTELFIELGATESREVILSKAAHEKSEAMLLETRKHNERIKAFADEFARLDGFAFSRSEFDSRAAALDAYAHELDGRASEFEAKCSEFSAKESELVARESLLASRDAELSKREELLNALDKEINNNLCGKISRSIRALFK
jgi:hypothetical protein